MYSKQLVSDGVVIVVVTSNSDIKRQVRGYLQEQLPLSGELRPRQKPEELEADRDPQVEESSDHVAAAAVFLGFGSGVRVTNFSDSSFFFVFFDDSGRFFDVVVGPRVDGAMI